MPIPMKSSTQCRHVVNALRTLGERADVIAENLWVTAHCGVPGYTLTEPAREFVSDRTGLDIVIDWRKNKVLLRMQGQLLAELTVEDGVPEALFEYARRFHAGAYPYLIADETTQAAVRADRCG